MDKYPRKTKKLYHQMSLFSPTQADELQRRYENYGPDLTGKILSHTSVKSLKKAYIFLGRGSHAHLC